MAKLKDIAAVCKSKNAGPFELTIDAVFADKDMFEKVKATGVIVDLAVHDIDLACHLTGRQVQEVHSVSTTTFAEHEDCAAILLRMQGDVSAQITTNWITPYKARSIQVVTAEAVFEADLLSHAVRRLGRFSVRDHSYTVRDLPVVRQEPLAAELQAFHDAVLDGSPAPIDGRDGLRALEVALRATARGRGDRPGRAA